MSSDFQSTAGFNLEFGYFFKEDWGLELMYNSYSNSNNDSFENIKKINGQEPFVRKPISNMALMFTWSPFYGKVNTFNKIYYFDWSFGVGVAKLETESNANTVANGDTNLKRVQVLSIGNALSYIGMIVVTLYVAPLDEKISREHLITCITPLPFAYSIWGLIYLLQGKFF